MSRMIINLLLSCCLICQIIKNVNAGLLFSVALVYGVWCIFCGPCVWCMVYFLWPLCMVYGVFSVVLVCMTNQNLKDLCKGIKSVSQALIL